MILKRPKGRGRHGGEQSRETPYALALDPVCRYDWSLFPCFNLHRNFTPTHKPECGTLVVRRAKYIRDECTTIVRELYIDYQTLRRRFVSRSRSDAMLSPFVQLKQERSSVPTPVVVLRERMPPDTGLAGLSGCIRNRGTLAERGPRTVRQNRRHRELTGGISPVHVLVCQLAWHGNRELRSNVLIVQWATGLVKATNAMNRTEGEILDVALLIAGAEEPLIVRVPLCLTEPETNRRDAPPAAFAAPIRVVDLNIKRHVLPVKNVGLDAARRARQEATVGVGLRNSGCTLSRRQHAQGYDLLG